MHTIEPVISIFSSRIHECAHLSTRQHALIVDGWVSHICFDQNAYGTHNMRRTKPILIYKQTKTLRGVDTWSHQPESTVRYLGIEVDDALKMAEQAGI